MKFSRRQLMIFMNMLNASKAGESNRLLSSRLFLPLMRCSRGQGKNCPCWFRQMPIKRMMRVDSCIMCCLFEFNNSTLRKQEEYKNDQSNGLQYSIHPFLFLILVCRQ
mmetsp:Transcript_510/g.834  ORF Transcript_510/g.834 Transcript_510/m.834 type:complete len:108 (-) Transcript_510:1119-1442(-)